MGKTAAKAKAYNSESKARESAADLWFPPRGTKVKGVVVVSHGLNLLPARMDELAQELAEAGYEVFRPAFAGHHGKNEFYLSVRAAHWEQDAREIYALAKARAEAKKVTLSLVAFSFSAAVFHALREELPFHRRIYLAPALALKTWFPVVEAMARCLPRLRYRSMNLRGYFANPIGGTKSVTALGHFYRRSSRGAAPKEPVLIWVDPEDELVSYRGLRKLAGKHPDWRLEKLSVAGSTLARPYHHLVVTQEALGAKEWRRLVDGSLDFLAQSSSR